MASFDQYNCTFHEVSPLLIMRTLERAEPFAVIEPDRPKNGYQVGQVLKHGGDAIARVWWQGNPGVHVICHSEHSVRLAPVLRGLAGHQVTRVDAREDWIEAGMFDRLAAPLIGYAKAHGIVINQLGDWVRGEGRTLYLGSRSSPVMLRLYEKGYQIGIHAGGNPDHVRLEVEVKPKGAANRHAVSRWTPGECFAASQWVVEALKTIGWDHLQAKSIGTVYRPSDDERARLAIQRQYGQVLRRWFEETGDAQAFAGELLAGVPLGKMSVGLPDLAAFGDVHHEAEETSPADAGR